MAIDDDPASLLATATEAALGAGALLRAGFGSSFRIENKEGVHNLVTEYDMASETFIFNCIQKKYPHHNILSEEAGEKKQSSSVTWIVDPLDGTVNFAHNVPMFSISIAAAVEAEIVCGVVYQPMLHELFSAEKGKGAFLNDQRLSVSSNARLDKAFLVTGFPYNVDQNPLHCIDQLAELLKCGLPVRRLGSAALDLCYVAAGRFDGYWEVSLHPWDMAAGKLIVEEAGGIVTRYDGSPRPTFNHENILAANKNLHPAMVEFLKPYLR